MNSKFKKILLLIGLVSLIVIGVIIIPRAISIFYQVRGGQQIEYLLRSYNDYPDLELTCDQLFSTGEEVDEIEDAIADLEFALRFNSNNSQSYYYLGQAFCVLGNPTKAKENYFQYIQLRPLNPLGFIGLGFAYEELGDPFAASNAWRSADLTASDFNQAGDEVFKEEQYEDAILWYRRALLVEPESAESWLNIGSAYDELQDNESALDAYRNAWEINPEQSTTALVESYKRNGDLNSVKDVLQQMIEKFSNSSDRLLWFQELGSSYLSQGDYDQAVDLYSLAIIEFADQPDLHISLGWALYERGGGVNVAQNEFNKAIHLEDDNAAGYVALAKLLAQENKYQEADVYFLEAIERSPNNRWYQLARAENIRISGDIARAIEIYLELIARYSDFPNAYNQLAHAYRLNENYPEAIEAIEQAMNLMDPPLSGYYSRAGEIYRLAGMPDEAISAYYQALALNPNNEIALRGLQLLEGE